MGKIYNSILGGLLVAVVVLFCIVLSKKNKTKIEQIVSNSAALPIAYFEPDSIINNYEFSKTKKKDLEIAVNKANEELNKYNIEFENQKQKYEAMTPSDEKEKALLMLQEMQQNNEAKKDRAEQNLDEAKQKFQIELRKNIELYLKKINTPQRFSLIISYEPSYIYYKDSSLNITNQIIEGLNKEYKKD